MELPSLDWLKQKLQNYQTPLGGAWNDTEFLPSTLSAEDLKEAETMLNETMPPNLASLMLKYDLNNFSIGCAFFGSHSSTNFARFLVEENSSPQTQWWEDGPRPKGYLAIGGTDGFVLLVNVRNDAILAKLRSGYRDEHEVIAENLEKYFCAMGYLSLPGNGFLDEMPDRAVKIGALAGADSNCRYWWDTGMGAT